MEKGKLVPSKEKDGLTFFPVPKVTDVSIAFGAREEDYFNRYDLPEVPSKFTQMASGLMFKGGNLPDEMSDKVDKQDAVRYLQAMLTSWAPAHEAKEATVGYALWVWCTDEILN